MEPIKFWDFISRIVGGLGYEWYMLNHRTYSWGCCFICYASWWSFFIIIFCSPTTKIPVVVIMPVAHLVEWTYKIFHRYGMRVPQLTPSRVRLLSCNRTFNCSKARDQLSYRPIVSLEVSLKVYLHLITWLLELHVHFSFDSGRVEEDHRFLCSFTS